MRYFFIIDSLAKNSYVRQTCRETWLNRKRKPFNHLFFVSGSVFSTKENDIFFTGLEDSYGSPKKTLRVLNLLQDDDYDEFEYIIKCKDTCFFDSYKFDKFVLENPLNGCIHDGDNFILSRKFLPLLLATEDTYSSNGEMLEKKCKILNIPCQENRFPSFLKNNLTYRNRHVV